MGITVGHLREKFCVRNLSSSCHFQMCSARNWKTKYGTRSSAQLLLRCHLAIIHFVS